MLNLQNSQLDLHVGLTAGQAFGQTKDQATAAGDLAKTGSTVPFFGVYGALVGGSFTADLGLRRDRFDLQVTTRTNGVSLAQEAKDHAGATTLSGAFAYRFDLRDGLELEPSVGFARSWADVDALAFAGGFGATRFDKIDSALGRLGLRIAQRYDVNGWRLQPFASANLWREFAGDAVSVYQYAGTDLPIATTRLGTFAQISAGATAELPAAGILTWLRLDLRTGSSITGYGFTGGMRYQF